MQLEDVKLMNCCSCFLFNENPLRHFLTRFGGLLQHYAKFVLAAGIIFKTLQTWRPCTAYATNATIMLKAKNLGNPQKQSTLEEWRKDQDHIWNCDETVTLKSAVCFFHLPTAWITKQMDWLKNRPLGVMGNLELSDGSSQECFSTGGNKAKTQQAPCWNSECSFLGSKGTAFQRKHVHLRNQEPGLAWKMTISNWDKSSAEGLKDRGTWHLWSFLCAKASFLLPVFSCFVIRAGRVFACKRLGTIIHRPLKSFAF